MAQLPAGPSEGVVTQTVRLHRDPLGWLRGAQARFGDVFTIRLATARPLVVVGDPDAAAELAGSDRAGAARRHILPMASPRGAFGGDGAAHRSARARLEGALSAEALAPHAAAMERLAAGHAARWPANRPFRLLPRVRTLVDDVFVRLVLGVRDEARARAATAAVRRMLWTPGNPPFGLPGAGLAGKAADALFARRRAPLAAVLEEEVAARRQHGGLGDDLIGAVLRDEPEASPAAIVDELLVVVMAAQEPPSIALTRLLDRRARGQEPTDSVVRETLRLWPPAFALLRTLQSPREVGGHPLPAGVTVVLPAPLLHRDARAFPEPDAFRPERDHGAAELRPFGAGARRCVGEHLAQLYFDVLLPAIDVGLRPLAPEPDRMVLRGTVLVPEHGVRVTRC
jgi:cytochrome P450 family 135